MDRGRPSKYVGDKKWLEMVTNYCLLGASDTELAGYLEITPSTLNEWKKKFPKFSESIKEGRADADSLVSRSLYRKALEGDVRASEIWLRNRQRSKWANNGQSEIKVESIEGSLAQEIMKANENKDN